MSRHRNVRTMNIDDEYYDEDDVYGHSVEDNYCISPGTTAQFTFNRDRGHALSSFMADEHIPEEEEDESLTEASPRDAKHDSACNITDLDKAKLFSCLEEIHNIVGDTYPDSVLTEAILKNNYNIQSSLNDIFSKQDKPKPQREPRQNRRADRQADRKTEQADPVPKLDAVPSSEKIAKLSDSVSQVKVSSSKEAVRGFQTSKQATKTDLSKPSVGITHSSSGVDLYIADNSESQNSATPSRNKSPNGSRLAAQAEGAEATPLKKSPSASRLASQIDGPPSLPSTPKNYAKNKQDKAALKAEYEKRQTGKDMLNLVVIGHVDAGKSTLMGHVLFQLGQVNKRTMHKYEQESKKLGKSSFAYAWVLDETDEERARGVTMDVAQTRFETPNKIITLLDAPGHKDFIPNMITGAAQADVAILVVNSTKGEFETGFDSGGQTREHALLARSLGVGQLIVAVNKMDTVDWSKDRYDEIVSKLGQFVKQVGFREGDMSFVPCSGLNGENLTTSITEPALKEWYKGCTLMEQIDKFKSLERPIDKPFRLCVGDVFKGMGSGYNISGRISSGCVQVGDRLLVMPSGEIATVKAITIDEAPSTYAFAGDHVILTIINVDINNVYFGSVLCDPSVPMRCATRIRAKVVIFNIEVPITKGFPVVFHYQSLNEPAVIKRLISQLHKSTGEVIKNKPKCLMKNCSAVVEIEYEKPICLEVYKDFKDLGRFMLRQSGHTIAAGLVEEVISTSSRLE